MSRRREIVWPLIGLAAPLIAYTALELRTAWLSDKDHAKSGRGRSTTSSQDDARAPLQAAARMSEPGRGRHSRRPWQIPFKGWKDILFRTYEQIGDDRLLAVAAGVVFYGLLALFPAVTALVSLYGLFASPASINEHLSIAAGILPQGAIDIIQEQVSRIAAKGESSLGFTFLFGLALALWSANAGMKAVFDALNVIYDEREKRGFITLNLVSLLFTLGAIAAILVAMAAVVAIPVVLQFVDLGAWGEVLLSVARWPILLVLVIFALAILYRYAPSRREPQWSWISVGSVLAAVAWLGASALLSWYISNFGSYDATYGSLGAAIGMMMWMWVSAIVILFGAELNSEIEHQTAADSTVGKGEKPLGTRGATMADTIGQAKAA